jgi:hypothetical protein
VYPALTMPAEVHSRLWRSCPAEGTRRGDFGDSGHFCIFPSLASQCVEPMLPESAEQGHEGRGQGVRQAVATAKARLRIYARLRLPREMK